MAAANQQLPLLQRHLHLLQPHHYYARMLQPQDYWETPTAKALSPWGAVTAAPNSTECKLTVSQVYSTILGDCHSCCTIRGCATAALISNSPTVPKVGLHQLPSSWQLQYRQSGCGNMQLNLPHKMPIQRHWWLSHAESKGIVVDWKIAW